MILVQLAAETPPPLCCLSHQEGTGLRLGCRPRNLEAIGVASAHDAYEQKALIWGLNAHCSRTTIMRVICKQLASLPTSQAESTIGLKQIPYAKYMTVHSAHSLICQAMKVVGIDADDLQPSASAMG